MLIQNSRSELIKNEIQVIEGRLYFPTKEEFTKEYDARKKKRDIDIYKEVSKFYSKDFMSLRPIVTEENEQEIFNQLAFRKEKFLNKRVEVSS